MKYYVGYQEAVCRFSVYFYEKGILRIIETDGRVGNTNAIWNGTFGIFDTLEEALKDADKRNGF